MATQDDLGETAQRMISDLERALEHNRRLTADAIDHKMEADDGVQAIRRAVDPTLSGGSLEERIQTGVDAAKRLRDERDFYKSRCAHLDDVRRLCLLIARGVTEEEPTDA